MDVAMAAAAAARPVALVAAGLGEWPETLPTSADKFCAHTTRHNRQSSISSVL